MPADKGKKKAHLLGFMQNGFNSHATGMWRHPRDKVNWDYGHYDYWQHIARVLERACSTRSSSPISWRRTPPTRARPTPA
jgi:hypothetical protein